MGEAIVKHPYVVKVNFTGDSETGKRILALASAAVKPVACELGGKNAFIVMPDADMKATVEGAVWGGFFNSGQNCGASSRYLVHEKVYDEFVEKFVAAAKLLRVGDPLNPETMIGPVAYKGHRDNIERFVARAKNPEQSCSLAGNAPILRKPRMDALSLQQSSGTAILNRRLCRKRYSARRRSGQIQDFGRSCGDR